MREMVCVQRERERKCARARERRRERGIGGERVCARERKRERGIVVILEMVCVQRERARESEIERYCCQDGDGVCVEGEIIKK